MPAMSAGVPQRPAGVRFSTRSCNPDTCCRARCVNSVSIQPGSTAFTWILSPAQAVASALRHLHDAALAGAVRRGIGRAEQRHHRADIDHLPAAGALHRVIRRLRQQERAGQVGVQHRVPLFFRVVLRHLADRRAGIVHQDVKPAEFFLRLRNQLHAVRLPRDVGGDERRLHAERPQRFQRGLRLLRIAAGDRDGRTAGRHALRHAEADAAVAAGDQRHLAGEVEQFHQAVRSLVSAYKKSRPSP